MFYKYNFYPPAEGYASAEDRFKGGGPRDPGHQGRKKVPQAAAGA